MGPTIQALLTELVDTGTCGKWEEWKGRVPESVLELRDVPGLGAKMARTLFLDLGIDGLEALERRLEAGALDGVRGLGPKRVTGIRRHLEARRRGEV